MAYPVSSAFFECAAPELVRAMVSQCMAEFRDNGRVSRHHLLSCVEERLFASRDGFRQGRPGICRGVAHPFRRARVSLCLNMHVHDRNRLCAPDAPVVMKVEEKDIAEAAMMLQGDLDEDKEPGTEE